MYYAKRIALEEYEDWVKKVRIFTLKNNISMKELASITGYSRATLYAALTNYERCSRFVVARVEDLMEEYGEVN
jgi:lambda repressor-like predicted transcriptional regulator